MALRALIRAGAISLAVLAAAGCSGLPTSSRVQAGQAIDNHPPAVGNIEYPPPAPGASQGEIVEGFLDATGGANPNYDRAREYLTRAASADWQPHSAVVTLGTPDTLSTGPDTITATQTVTGLLDSSGHLTEQPAGTVKQAGFQLAKVNGQWRISSVPKGFGLWMNVVQFKRVYQPEEIYYPAANASTLVPDTRWYPQVGLVSSLAAAVLEGAPPWLRGMTLEPLPAGSRLTGSSVSIDNNGVATVNVSDKVLAATPEQRTGLWASMLATLTQVSDVRRVVVVVDGARLQSTDLPDAPSVPTDVGYTVVSGNPAQLIARTSPTTLQWTDPDESIGTDVREHNQFKTQPTLPTISRNWYRIAASADGSQLAAIDGANATLGRWVNGRQTQISGFGTGLVTPSFSSAKSLTGSTVNELWVAGESVPANRSGKADDATIWALDESLPLDDAQPQPVSAPWLRGMTIRAIRVSPDGERIAVVAQPPKGPTQVLVAAIVRDKKGHAQSLTTPLRVAASLTNVLDVGWVDYVTLAVLDSDYQNTVQVTNVPIGGLSSSLGDAPGGQYLVASGGGASSIYVETVRGTVVTKVGATWQRVGGLTAVVAAGT
ncbi:LpqB family beta-propeller domain-containing protein [Flexivirga caeni]|nr:LpqB family beta-propeller domain-containing protein [Flexivirga caeni]